MHKTLFDTAYRTLREGTVNNKTFNKQHFILFFVPAYLNSNCARFPRSPRHLGVVVARGRAVDPDGGDLAARVQPVDELGGDLGKQRSERVTKTLSDTRESGEGTVNSQTVNSQN